MKSLFSLVLAGFSVALLSACSTPENQMLPDTSMSNPPSYSTSQESPNMGTAIYTQETNNAAPSATVLSGGSVEIYDLGGDSSSVPSVTIAQGYGANQGGILASDSSVTIFPIDGGSSPVSSYNASPYGGYAGSSSADGKIYFSHGSARLGSGDVNKLSSVAEQAKFAPVSRITVEGYASQPTQAGEQSVEGHILNLKESMNRSFAVSRSLMQKGVPAEKIKTVSWGSTKATGNETEDRRVDVVMGER